MPTIKLCTNCGDPLGKRSARGYCHRCYDRFRRDGHFATRHYTKSEPGEPFACSNCGSDNTNRRVRGRCQGCDRYWRDNGEERPASLHASPPLVREERPVIYPTVSCDCGKPAVWVLTLPVSQQGKMKLLLCDDCAALEKRLAPVHSWAGS